MSGFTDSSGAAYMSNRMDWETPTDLFSRLEMNFTLGMGAQVQYGSPVAKAPSSSCCCRLARIPAGSNSSFSTVRRSGSSKGDCGSRRTAYRAGQRHSKA